jgi:hypothetical protein
MRCNILLVVIFSNHEYRMKLCALSAPCTPWIKHQQDVLLISTVERNGAHGYLHVLPVLALLWLCMWAWLVQAHSWCQARISQLFWVTMVSLLFLSVCLLEVPGFRSGMRWLVCVFGSSLWPLLLWSNCPRHWIGTAWGALVLVCGGGAFGSLIVVHACVVGRIGYSGRNFVASWNKGSYCWSIWIVYW